MKRDGSPFRAAHFDFSPSKRLLFKLRNASPQRAEPSRLLPITPGPKSAPLHKAPIYPVSLESPLLLNPRQDTPLIEAHDKPFIAASAGGGRKVTGITNGLSIFQDSSPHRPSLEAVSEACSQLVAGQNQLKARLRQHEMVLLRLRMSHSKSPKPSHAEVIQELRQYSRKSARKLWSRSETPNSRVQPSAYSQIPTPRANPLLISPAKDEAFTSFETGIRGTEKVTFMRPARFPRSVFTRKRKL